MNKSHLLSRLALFGLLLAVAAWSTGCMKPPSRIRPAKAGSHDANGNNTGSNITGSNVTGSNVTGAGIDIEDDVDDLGKAPQTLVDNVAATGGNSGSKQVDPAVAVEANKGYDVDPLDWPYVRGPHYNNTSLETGLVNDFNPAGGEGSNVVWFREDLGTRSTPIVMRGKLYTLTRSFPGTAKEGERVICVDAATGETIWENDFNVWLSDVPDTRVGWSSVVGDPTTGRVYALGVCGYFQCIDGDTGETIWSHPMHEEYGFLSTYGGRTNFPVVCDDVVIVSAVVIGWGEMAKPNHRFVAFDKNNGEVVWFNGTSALPDDTTYSAPALAVIDGEKQLIAGCGDGMIWSFQPRTGLPIWKYGISRRGLNTPPLVVGDRIFSGQSEEVWDPASTAMGSVVAFKAGQGDIPAGNVLWEHDEVMVGKSAPVMLDDRIYCFADGGSLYIYDAKTGKQIPLDIDRKLEKQIKFRNMRSNPLVADGKIYAVSEAGQWFIAKPDKAKGLDIVSFSGREKQLGDTNASPIASHGRVYITTTGGIYCLEDKNQKHGVAEPAMPQVGESPVKDDPKPAHLQLVPAEVLVRPGEKVEFTARLYNSNGQFLKEEGYPQFSIAGEGNITPGGRYTAPDEAKHQAATVTATIGDLTGAARIRIIPNLPWEFDFENVKLSGDQGKPQAGEPPVTWVGMRYRHQIREKDGNKVMVKVTTIPKGTAQPRLDRPPRPARLHDSSRRDGRVDQRPDAGDRHHRAGLHAGHCRQQSGNPNPHLGHAAASGTARSEYQRRRQQQVPLPVQVGSRQVVHHEAQGQQRRRRRQAARQGLAQGRRRAGRVDHPMRRPGPATRRRPRLLRRRQLRRDLF